MKKIIYWIALLLTTYSVLAGAQNQSPAAINIQVNMLYLTQNHDGQPVQTSLKKTYQIKTHAIHFTTLDPVKSAAPQIVLLQGKIIHAAADSATIQFLVFDLNNPASTVLAPKIVGHYGQEEKITLHEKHRDLELTLIANASH